MKLAIRTRLALWYVVFSALTIVGLGAFLVLELRSNLRSALDRELRESSAAISQSLGRQDFGTFRQISGLTLLRSGSGAQLLSPPGTVLTSYGGDIAQDPMLPAARVTRALRSAETMQEVQLGDAPQPFRVLSTPVAQGGERRLLVIGESLQGVNEAVRRILVLLLIAGPIVLVVSGMAGWLLLRNALLPVERMRRKAELIGIDRLDERLSATNPADEIGQLAATLNEMLDRLEAGVGTRRRLVADASHELRTPLAAMRAELDVSLREGGRSETERAVLGSLRDEVDRMSRTVANLLTLARADDRGLDLLRSDVDLADVAREAADRLRALATSCEIDLRIEAEPADARGDAHRLHQALVNLIENAIKYTPSGGQVRVQSFLKTNGDGAEEAVVTVSDTGIGIPESARDRVFDRFFRADPSRSRESGGSGLGLAICREIAAAHGGRIEVRSQDGRGSEFTLALPARD